MWHWLRQCPLSTMLINHDFDWEADLEESPRSGVDPTSANVSGPDPLASPRRPCPARRAGRHHRTPPRFFAFNPDPRARRPGLSVASIIPKAPRENAAATIDHPQTQPNHDSPERGSRHPPFHRR